MRTKLAVGLSLTAMLLFTGEAFAETSLDVCDALGLSGLTISSDTNCLQITGNVQYKFEWGDYAGSCDTGAQDCDYATYTLGDLVRFSNFRINVDPGYIFTAPDAVGLLESGTPATVPGYTLPVSYSGFKVGVGLDTRLKFDGFVPMDLGVDVEYGQITGKGSEGSRTGSYGIPSVGLIDGSPVGTITQIDSTDITHNRSFFGLDKQLHVPIFGGRHEWMGNDTAYTGYVIGGTRIGMINETQQTRLVTNAGTLNYDTTYSGGYAGGYLGFGIDKAMALQGSDLTLNGHASLTGGLDMHRYRVTSSVGGTAVAPSTNSYDVTDWVPTLKLGGGVSVGKDSWTAGFGGAVSAGYYPAFNTLYPVSNVHTAPLFDARAVVTAEFLSTFNFRF